MATASKSQPSGRSMDLGVLQKELETATRKLKAANVALNRAAATQAIEEQNHATLTKSMTAAFVQLQAATKVV